MRRAPMFPLVSGLRVPAHHRLLALCALSVVATGGLGSNALRAQEENAAGDADRIVNQPSTTRQLPVGPRVYDSHPSFVEPAGAARGFALWHSFAPGAERIIGRG